jgi:hypothetical protein
LSVPDITKNYEIVEGNIRVLTQTMKTSPLLYKGSEMKGIKESIMTLDLTYTEGRYRFPYS